MAALVRDRLMPVAPTPVRNRRQCAGVTVLRRYLPHHILACPRLAPDVSEAEEGERGIRHNTPQHFSALLRTGGEPSVSSAIPRRCAGVGPIDASRRRGPID